MTTEDLARRYDALNDAYFGLRLEPVAFRLSPRMTTTAGQFEPDAGVIAVSRRFLQAFPDEVDSLLLHEMVHVATRDGHGRAFRREWQRLVRLGAPVPSVYREFRHCPQFAPSRPRPHVYRCPVCGDHFPRTRPLGDARWCRPCVNRARREGADPFDKRRRLVPVPPGPVQERLFV